MGRRKNIFSKKLNDTSLLMSKQAAGNKKKAASVTYQCNIDTADMPELYKTAAIALTVLNDTRHHGKINVIFTAGVKGAQELPDKYLDSDNFIALTERAQPRLFTGSAAMAEYRIRKPLTRRAPEGTRAFRISISGCMGGDSSERDVRHVNPIRKIGDILNSCRDDGLVIEIADFNGGEAANDYPQSASCTLVINSSEAGKLQTKLENARDSYVEDNLKNEPEMKVAVSEVPVPDRVLSSADTSSVMNLMYTMKNGVYARSRDEENKGTITALANIGTISTRGSELNIGIFVRSTDSRVFKEMATTYDELAGLSDAHFKVVSTVPNWPLKSPEEDPLAESLILAGKQCDLTLDPSATFMQNVGAIFYSKKKDLNIVMIGVTMTNILDITKTFVTFNESLVNNENSNKITQ
ncbi:MAG: hypothetical protein ACOX4I_05665 [Anaerovoracaceae bacterium]